MSLLHPELLVLGFLGPLSVLLLLLARRRNLRWQQAWGGETGFLQAARPWMLGAVVLLVVAALARPVWNPQPVTGQTQGQDVVILVDVSNSMLTPDLDKGQSRSDGVKQALIDLLPLLKGDQVALVAFAGTTVVKCPLTTDLAYFSQALTLLQPGSTARGGTMLGDALRQVKQDFVRPDGQLAVWVFTDGGDQESFPVEAARDLADTRTRLFIWGVGSLSGGQVPGKDVSSVLNEGLLRDIAMTLPGSAYWGAETPLWQLGSAYQSHRVAASTLQTSRVVWQEGSWWLLWPIIVLVVLSSPIRLPRSKGGRS